jgi:protein-S-isoprenylcysteine O-methyltransferase Ste14
VQTAAQAVVFWGFALFVVPPLLVRAQRALGIATIPALGQCLGAALLFTLSSVLGLSSAAVMTVRGRGTPLPMQSPRLLVTAGPYRVVRNPMAVAGIGQGIAVAWWWGSWPVLLYAFSGGVLWHILVRPLEERDLTARFGAAYEAYRGRVPLWFPRPRALPPA